MKFSPSLLDNWNIVFRTMCSCNDLKKFMWMLVRKCFAILFMNSSNIKIFYENITIRFKTNKKWNENNCVCLSIFYLKTYLIKFSPIKRRRKIHGDLGELLKIIRLGNGVYIIVDLLKFIYLIFKYTEQAENTLQNSNMQYCFRSYF